MTFKAFQPSSWQVYLQPNHVCGVIIVSSDFFYLTMPVWLTDSPSVPTAKTTIYSVCCLPLPTVWWLQDMSVCPNIVLEKTLDHTWIWIYPRHSCEPSLTLSFLSQGVSKGKTGQLLLIGWMRPSFDVPPLCQTCQETEMDSYRGRSCNRQGWRGGADSRLTAVINHLPHQPDAGWQEGARWLEWRFEHSLP